MGIDVSMNAARDNGLMTGALSGARVLVVGGSSTIGAALVDQLVRGGAADVVVVDTITDGQRRSLAWANEYHQVAVVAGDLRDSELVGALMHGVNLLFHQSAACAPRAGEDRRHAWVRLVDGVSTVFEAGVRAGVHKIILGSLPHDAQGTTGSDRAAAFAEDLLRSLHKTHGLDYVALRYADVYGPRMAAPSSLSDTLIAWMARIDGGQPPLLPGNGQQTRDLVFTNDVARANLFAAEAAITNEVCYVASGTRTSLRRLAAELLHVMGAPLEPELLPLPRTRTPGRHHQDRCDARQLLGFRVETGLEEGLRQLVDWWRGQRCRAPERTWAGV
jgi:UDP-glucose 4-epimerase